MLISHEQQARQLGGQIVAGDMSREFWGAAVDRTGLTDLIVPTATIQQIDYLFVSYDIGGWFNLANPDRFTVPAGVTRVRHWYNCRFLGTFDTGVSVAVDPYLNGSLHNGFGRCIFTPATTINNEWTVTSPSYPVVEGDEISCRFNSNNTVGNVTISAGDDNSFAVEAVTMEF